MVTIQELLQELDEEGRGTRRVLERVREDRLHWKPHEKSMTLGQLAMHVATLPGALAEISTRPTFDVKTPIPRPEAKNRAELIATLERSVADAKATLTGMGDGGLDAPWKLVNDETEITTVPRRAFLRRLMLNHWYHHRGQLIVYLRQTETPVPGLYGDSADEKGLPG